MFRLTRQYNWLVFSIINPNLERRLGRYASGKMIDIGCGEKPYQEMASAYVDEHVGVDTKETLHDKSNIDAIATAYQLPFSDGAFDCAICTDTLEHLEAPHLAIAEAFRVLKPGGYAIYTVPLFWHLHEEPRDFYRYTKYGLTHLFETNGFEVNEIKALSGFCVTFGQELVYYLYGLRRGGKANPLWWLIPPVGHFIQSIAWLLNLVDFSENYTIEYIAVVRRPLKS